MILQKQLISNRLSLSPLTITDDNFILALVNSEGWLKFIGDRNVSSQKKAQDYIRKILESKNIVYWVVRLRSSQSPAGIITFIKRDYLDHPDIGFAFLPEFSKNGYAYEATSAVLEYVKEVQKLTHVLATTIPENSNSIRLLKKFGFEFEKDIQVENEKLHVYRLSVAELN